MSSNKRSHLTPPVRKQIVASIRAGGYPHVAAEAWGVPKTIFDDWLKRGSQDDAREPHLSFAKDVREAFAQARLRAEMAVFEAEPKLWLIHGPGRENEDRPGWSLSVKPAEMALQARNALCDPELMALFGTVLEVLRPFPDARLQVAEALIKLGMQQDTEKQHGETSVQDGA